MDPIKYAKIVGRYLIHGTINSLILIGIIISVQFIFTSSLFSDLLLFGTILFLSSFILVLIGIVNVYTTEYLWKQETSKHWLSLLIHGFFLVLGSLGIYLGSLVFILIALSRVPIISNVSIVPTIILFVLVNGLYGKGLANYVTHIGSLLRS
jgi:hypothetical protein